VGERGESSGKLCGKRKSGTQRNEKKTRNRERRMGSVKVNVEVTRKEDARNYGRENTERMAASLSLKSMSGTRAISVEARGLRRPDTETLLTAHDEGRRSNTMQPLSITRTRCISITHTRPPPIPITTTVINHKHAHVGISITSCTRYISITRTHHKTDHHNHDQSRTPQHHHHHLHQTHHPESSSDKAD